MFYKKAGLVYEDQKEYGNALEMYTKIKKDFAEAPEATDIDKYIARVETLKADN